MAVTHDERQTRNRPLAGVERWVLTAPLWAWTAITLLATTALHGLQLSTAMPATVLVTADPFTQNHDTGAWMYSSPLGPMIAWALHARTAAAIGRVSYLITAAVVAVSVWAVARYASTYAAKLWLVAYWCSPQSWAGTANLGEFDIITVGGLTVCAVAPTGACVAAGTVVGFNHFEQGGIALVAIAFIRIVMRHESHMPMVGAFVGLVAGKAALMAYLVASGIDTSGRVDFIRDTGLRDIVGGWTGHIPLMEFAVYNVLWVAVIWMVWTMRPKDRWRVLGLHLLLTLPVLITYDLSRVYRTVTWPIVMLLVLYASEWPDRRLVQRAALVLALAAIVVPRVEIWHGGYRIN